MTSEIKQLEDSVRRHNHAYFVLNSPEISDEEFDRLVLKLTKLAPNSPVLLELGSDLINKPSSKRIKHKRPMLSLDKCYDLDSFSKWFEKIQGSVLSMPKIDGVACSIQYDNSGKLRLAATRGDGKEGEDITQNVLRISDIPSSLDASLRWHDKEKRWHDNGKRGNNKTLEIRGEIYMKLPRFNEHYAEQFANPRNLTAGAIKQKDPNKSAAYGLSFFAYDINGTNLETEEEKFNFLTSLGFEAMPIELLNSPEACELNYKNFDKQRPNLDYEIDGVVFRANQVSEQSRLGLTAHHPKWAIAYKFQGDSAHTKLIGIDWSVARTGVITPVAIVEPVLASGAMVSRASLHNLTLFQNLELSKGAIVEIVRRGGVIPHVESVLESKGDTLSHPKQCPSCQKETVIDGEFLCCPEPESCPDIIASRLIHFCSVLELEGFGEKIIRALIKAELIKEPADLFRLKFENLILLDRMGDKLANKLLDQLNQKHSISLPIFLTALGFDELGPTIAETLANKFETLDNLQKADLEDLKAIYGIGESIADSLILGFKAFKTEIDSLLKVIQITKPEKSVFDANHALFKKSIVFTGTLTQFDRKEAQKKVRALGGQTPATVSASTDYLVIGEGKPSSKQKKAEKLGVSIITEQEFVALL